MWYNAVTSDATHFAFDGYILLPKLTDLLTEIAIVVLSISLHLPLYMQKRDIRPTMQLLSPALPQHHESASA
jgi:hypothetical protein